MAVISSPVVYNTQTKSKNKWLTVFDASVTLTTDASSSASIRLAEGEQISGRTYVEMFTAQGSAGMFRTRSPRTGIRQGTTVELEHAINDLGDYIVAASIEKEMTLKAALQKVFSYYKGGLWKLGSVDKGTDIKVILDTEYETCMDAINGIMEQVPEMYMSYAYDKSPWSLNIREREKTVTAEGRISRNVKSAVIEMDDSDLCTKVFMKGLGGTDKWGSETDSNAQKKYGTIEKVITGANSTKAISQSTAKSYLKRHKKPRYTITIDAIELSDITKQSIDKFTIGKKCRLALPKYGINVEENITQISWQSIYQNPNSVTVTLSDQEDTVVKHITQQAKATARSVKKVQAKAQKAEETAVASVCTASVANNVLTLKDGNGKVLVNFSKNVALVRVPASNQGWSNGAFTVNATQTNKNTKTGAAETTIVNTIGTEIKDVQMGTISESGRDMTVPVTVMYKTSTNTGKSTGYTQDLIIRNVHAGVTLADPTWLRAPSSDITGNSNTVSVSTEGRTPTLTKSVVLYLTYGNWSAGKRYMYITQTDTTAANRVARYEVDAHLSDPSWLRTPSSEITGNSNTVTVESATGQSKSVVLYVTPGSWNTSTGKRYVYMTQTDTTASNRVARYEIDAHLNDPSWLNAPSENITGNSNTVTVESATGQSKAVVLYLTYGNWNTTTGKRYMYITQTDTTAANRVARYEVDAHLNDFTWTNTPAASPQSNSNTLTASSATGQSKSVVLYVTPGSWSNGRRTIYMTKDDTSTETNRLAKYDVDAHLYDISWSRDPAEGITGNSNTVIAKSATGEQKTLVLYLTYGSWNATTGKRYMYITQTDTTAANRVARYEVDAHLNDPSWLNDPSSSITGNSNTITVSSATGQSKSVVLYLTYGDWNTSTGKRYMYITQTDTTAANRVARYQVDAHLNDFTWSNTPSSSPSSNSNTITETSATGQSKSLTLYVYAASSWSSGSRTIYMSHTDTNTASYRIGKLSITAPAPTCSSVSYALTAPSDGTDAGKTISKSSISANTYLITVMSYGGTTKKLYYKLT